MQGFIIKVDNVHAFTYKHIDDDEKPYNFTKKDNLKLNKLFELDKEWTDKTSQDWPHLSIVIDKKTVNDDDKNDVRRELLFKLGRVIYSYVGLMHSHRAVNDYARSHQYLEDDMAEFNTYPFKNEIYKMLVSVAYGLVWKNNLESSIFNTSWYNLKENVKMKEEWDKMVKDELELWEAGYSVIDILKTTSENFFKNWGKKQLTDANKDTNLIKMKNEILKIISEPYPWSEEGRGYKYLVLKIKPEKNTEFINTFNKFFKGNEDNEDNEDKKKFKKIVAVAHGYAMFQTAEGSQQTPQAFNEYYIDVALGQAIEILRGKKETPYDIWELIREFEEKKNDIEEKKK